MQWRSREASQGEQFRNIDRSSRLFHKDNDQSRSRNLFCRAQQQQVRLHVRSAL